jgi:hypothetical protein
MWRLTRMTAVFQSKAVILSLILLTHGVMLQDTLRREIWPVKRALLVGGNLVGRLSETVDPTIPIESPWGYDSQFFWAISMDPFLQNPQVAQSLDAPSYRYQRVFFPFLVWLVCPSVSQLPYYLLAVNVAGWLVGVSAVLRLSRYYQIGWKLPVLMFATNAGIIFSLIHPLADLWATVLILLALSCWVEERYVYACLCFALAGLTKETTVLVPASIVLFNIVRRRIWFEKENVVLCLAVVPMLLWQEFIHHRLGVWAWQQSMNNFDYPYFAIVKVTVRSLDRDAFTSGMTLLFCLLTIVCVRFWGNLLGMLAYVQAVFFSFLGTAIVEGIGSASRASILFYLFFVFSVLAPARDRSGF